MVVHLPIFWPVDLTVWLAQAESQFILVRIAMQSMKFQHIIWILPSDVAPDVVDILCDPLW